MKKLIFLFAVMGMFAVSGSAHAMTPTVSLYASGGDSVQVSIYGDPYAQATLYYQRAGYGTQSQSIGTTSSSGYASATLSTSSLGVSSGSTVYVIVNGQTSQSVSWTYSNSSVPDMVRLSQNSISVGLNQPTTISVSGGYEPYVMYPSTTTVFQSALGGRTLTVWGLATGSGTLNVCSSGISSGGSGCATLYVTVVTSTTNYNNYTNYTTPTGVSMSPSSVNLTTGQTTSIAISGGSYYTIGYNSNSSAIQATISGSTLSLTGLSQTAGVIVVCSSSISCGAVTVFVSGASYGTQNSGVWSYCSNENQLCYFSGTRQVRYGANGVYFYRTHTNSVACSNAIFGDPIFGVVKQCSVM